ncbi:MAG: hypothetical protein ACT4N8_09545 [Sphingosinicella sp.]|uniref:hypothetical protein n=1 Tax=Sphingosinicella sp. TaxID=1917971 RepID=UPI004037F289
MDDEAAIGAVVDEMYAMISGPRGPRDWSRQANCFHPDARQIRTFIGPDGRAAFKAMGQEEYVRDTTSFFAENDFFEVEIGRRIDLFGNIAHVWSAYEARTALDDAAPERRGINSIQLFKDPERGWRITSMIWDNEREGVAIPADLAG